MTDIDLSRTNFEPNSSFGSTAGGAAVLEPGIEEQAPGWGWSENPLCDGGDDLDDDEAYFLDDDDDDDDDLDEDYDDDFDDEDDEETDSDLDSDDDDL